MLLLGKIIFPEEQRKVRSNDENKDYAKILALMYI